MTECQAELCDGIFKDLHKDPFEGYVATSGLDLPLPLNPYALPAFRIDLTRN